MHNFYSTLLGSPQDSAAKEEKDNLKCSTFYLLQFAAKSKKREKNMSFRSIKHQQNGAESNLKCFTH